MELQRNGLLLLQLPAKSTSQSVSIDITVLLSGHILAVFSILGVKFYSTDSIVWVELYDTHLKALHFVCLHNKLPAINTD